MQWIAVESVSPEIAEEWEMLTGKGEGVRHVSDVVPCGDSYPRTTVYFVIQGDYHTRN